MNRTLFLACERGAAPYVQAELQRKGFPKPKKTTQTTLTVEGLDEKELVRAAYTLQTPTRVGMHLGATEVTLDTEESVLALETLIGALDLGEILVKGKSFLVKCDREGSHEYNSVDLSQAAGRLIKRYAKEGLSFVPTVDLKKPEILLYLHVDGTQAWLSLDLVGYEADKRAYKVFNNPHSMKGSTAAALLMASGWAPGKTMLDPYAGGGEISIEAALFASRRSAHHYEKRLACKQHPLFSEAFKEVAEEVDGAIEDVDAKTINSYDAQLRNVTAAKKNAKIAGVDKAITFSKLDVEWIDTKLAEKSVDCIITQPVEASKHIPEQKAMQLHKQLFYGADFVLAKGGSLTFLCGKPEDLQLAAEQYGFVVDDREQLFTGKLPRWVVRFVRK